MCNEYDSIDCCCGCKCCCNCGTAQTEPEYALFYSNGVLYNRALAGGIFFSEDSITTDAFILDANIIQIIKPGIYMARYILNIPAEASIDTRISLMVGQNSMPGTVKNVSKSADGISTEVSGETIFEVENYTSMRLSSFRIINISGEANETMATLMLVKIG